MNFIFVLAMMTPTVTPLAQFNDRAACMAEAVKLKEQGVQAACLPKQVPTDKEVAAELNKALGVMRAMMLAMQD